jgi:hypothetical protein
MIFTADAPQGNAAAVRAVLLASAAAAACVKLLLMAPALYHSTDYEVRPITQVNGRKSAPRRHVSPPLAQCASCGVQVHAS